ncbi:Flagellar biosynthetic protein FlhB [Sodalis glossinidius str. 'morsitans']|uniref:Flagellar biosynthetic protein FlhB n=1 Tax=Sodalis glossinidius (strain morsitans) TaxID=343509 RepID=Q2NR87_SODGM|nr:putative flagellar biosynthetic protein FlhB [Sodalis glossinidius str. 'morsitans']CRL46356.1 Flagellar biosynthetic protein FlhB [Sodalis glossinidius str. 'morsitans']
MAEDIDLEKSEAPTQHRQEKAREEGQIPRSRELTSMLMLLVGCAMLWLDGAYLARQLAAMLAQGLHFDHGLIGKDRQSLTAAAPLLSQTVLALISLFAGLILVALGAPMLLGGITFNPSLIKFDIKKVNPLSGLKRMFSSQVLAELFKAILKAVVFGCVTGSFLWHNWPRMLHLVMEPAVPALGDAMWIITACMLFIIVGLSPIVGFDVFWQLWSHLKKLRMIRQDIRDEFKNQEGDPHVKNRIR